MTSPATGPDQSASDPGSFGLDETLLHGPDGSIRVADLVADLRPGGLLAVAVAVAGVVPGALWALLAPQQKVVSLAGSTSPLVDETDHVFDATALFLLLVTAFGVVAGVLAWRWRSRRGPVLLVAATLGALVGGWVAAAVGTLLAPGGAPTSVLIDRALASASGTPGPPIPATLLVQPATLGTWWAVLGAALGAVLAYVLGAIGSGTEDMGRDPNPDPDWPAG